MSFISAWTTPFSISRKAGPVLNSLIFCLSEKVFICPSFLKNSFSGKVFLVGSHFLSALWRHHHTFPWPARFLLRDLLIHLWEFSCKRKIWNASWISMSSLCSHHANLCMFPILVYMLSKGSYVNFLMFCWILFVSILFKTFTLTFTDEISL